jgi:hypothetical protein
VIAQAAARSAAEGYVLPTGFAELVAEGVEFAKGRIHRRLKQG